MSAEPQVTAIFDLDGTITYNDTYLSLLLAYLQQHPVKLLNCWFLPFVVLIFKLGLKDNTWVKKKFLNAILGGASKTSIKEFVHHFIDITLEKKVKKEAIKQIQLHKEQGHYLVLATASFDFYVRELGANLGFNTIICTESLWDDDDKLKGEIDGDNCHGLHKLRKVSDYFKTKREKNYTILYSDHHSDLPLMEWVDEAIAINPTKRMRELAIQKEFEIRGW